MLILPTTVCSSEVARHIHNRLPETVAALHQHGCSQIGDDRDLTAEVLWRVAASPNVFGVVIVGLGCEAIPCEELAEAAAQSRKPVVSYNIQDVGGTASAIEKGVSAAAEMLAEAAKQSREPFPLSDLILGTECGGSDAWSGQTANPVIGRAADLMVEAGGTVILSETTEFIGAEHVLQRRARTPEVADDIKRIVDATEQRVIAYGADIRGGNPTPGNMAGGITTLEEKSLGCIHKGGTSVVQEVLRYAAPPTRKGLVVMDTPGQDVESITGMLAGGAQVVVFSTGRGSPVGAVVAPVIKICTNSVVYSKMPDDIDVNAGVIVTEGRSVDNVGDDLFGRIVAVASGEETCAERWGHVEFGIYRVGPTV